jgi:NADH:ubiquinone oxidoreductase subunit 3 (subunit A)
MDYFYVLLLVCLSALFVLGGLAFSRLLAPRHPGGIKNTPYECGERPIGEARIQFNVGYYLFGLLFLVFDVEAGFLYHWAVALRQAGVPGFIVAVIFVLVLIVGLMYAWKKGVLEWV